MTSDGDGRHRFRRHRDGDAGVFRDGFGLGGAGDRAKHMATIPANYRTVALTAATSRLDEDVMGGTCDVILTLNAPARAKGLPPSVGVSGTAMEGTDFGDILGGQGDRMVPGVPADAMMTNLTATITDDDTGRAARPSCRLSARARAYRIPEAAVSSARRPAR